MTLPSGGLVTEQCTIPAEGSGSVGPVIDASLQARQDLNPLQTCWKSRTFDML